MKILALVLAGLFLISPFARAVDEDDVYTDAYFGLRLDQSSQLQVGGIVGYGVADTVGIGLVFDDLISRSAADLSSNGTLIAAEGRWFLEPFEIASGIGGYWAINQPFRAVLLL